MISKKKIRERWTDNRQRLSRGRDEMGLVIGVIQMALLGGVFLKSVFNVPSKWTVLIVGITFILLVIAQYLLGYFMDKFGIISSYVTWISKRNRNIQEILRILKKLDEKDNH